MISRSNTKQTSTQRKRGRGFSHLVLSLPLSLVFKSIHFEYSPTSTLDGRKAPMVPEVQYSLRIQEQPPFAGRATTTVWKQRSAVSPSP